MKLFSIFAALFALAFSSAQAADAPAPMIATVNIQQIMKDSSAAKSVSGQLESKQKSFQSELTKRDADLQKEEKELSGQKGVLSKEAFEEKTRVFRKKVTDVQKDVQTKKVMLDNGYARAVGEIQKAVTEIVADLAKEKGFSVAVPTSQILYSDSKLDISSEVLERLNKKLSKVEVKFEAPK
jgi:outer membrane protein